MIDLGRGIDTQPARFDEAVIHNAPATTQANLLFGDICTPRFGVGHFDCYQYIAIRREPLSQRHIEVPKEADQFSRRKERH